MKMTLVQAFLAIIVSAGVIFCLRAFPFVVFAKKSPPKILQFIEKYIPPMVMAVLVIYCFKDVKFMQKPFGLKEIASLLVTVVLHLWKNNSMLSIFGGTILFMILGYYF